MKLLGDLKSAVPDNELTFDQVKDPQASVYQEMPSINQVPYSLHRKAIDSLNKLERAKEEQDALKIEITSLMAWHKRLYSMLETSLIENEGKFGRQAMIVGSLRRSESSQMNLVEASKIILTEGFIVSTPYLKEICTPIESSGILSYDSDCDWELRLELSDDDDLPSDDGEDL